MAILYPSRRPERPRAADLGEMFPTQTPDRAKGFGTASAQPAGVPGPGRQISSLLQEGRPALSRDYLRAALRRRAMRRAMGRRRVGQTSSRLFGLDPMQARGAMFQTERDAQSDLSDALGQAELADLSGYQDFIRSLLTGERGREFESSERDKQRKYEQDQNSFDPWSFLGETAGGILTSRLG